MRPKSLLFWYMGTAYRQKLTEEVNYLPTDSVFPMLFQY